ncbi:hypothetical protein PGB90_002092 [Kerria lacca]
MKRKRYEISSSDEETENKQEIFCSTSLPTSTISEIISQNEVVQYDANNLNYSDTLFSNDISKNDEIWFVQCPNEVKIKKLKNINLDFDSVETKVLPVAGSLIVCERGSIKRKIKTDVENL